MRKNIILAVSGGVAIYKSCELARALVKKGAAVKVVMTESAKRFATPLLFASLTQNEVYDDIFSAKGLLHISLAEWAEVMIVAPCTANTFAKISLGLADNLLTALALALDREKPIIIAPAMNDNMWENKATQAHWEKLKKDSHFQIIGPQKGLLASGKEGVGVMAKVEDIVLAWEKL